MTKDTVIVDLDGTLALNKHREHLIKEAGWDAYFRACGKDEPNADVISLVRTLSKHYKIHIMSGRSVSVVGETISWLKANWVPYTRLNMRDERNYTPDEELKRSWLHLFYKEPKEQIFLVLDDRQKVVDMWRNEGLTCLQVAEGTSDEQ